MPSPIPLLQFAGLLHLGLLAAGSLMPRAVGLRAALAPLPPFVRSLFWMYYTFIAFCLLSFGSASAFLAPHLASGTGLARAVCLFLAVFWTLRLVFATWILDLRPYLTSGLRRTGYRAVNLTFSLLIPLYLYSAIVGGRS